jgi:PPOX class probable F420-dependent enzyme
MIDFTSELGQKAMSRLSSEYFVWLTTISPSVIPQPRPVWFIWHADGFLIYSQPAAKKVRHLMEHTGVSLHFNSTDKNGEQDIIVFTGMASIDASLPRADLLPAYIHKYAAGIAGLGSTPEQFGAEYSIPIHIKPAVLRGW